MDSLQLVNRKVKKQEFLTIDSSKRSSGIPEDFVYTLPVLFKDVKAIYPLQVLISNNIYNLTIYSNSFSVNREGTIITKELPVGNYDID